MPGRKAGKEKQRAEEMASLANGCKVRSWSSESSLISLNDALGECPLPGECDNTKWLVYINITQPYMVCRAGHDPL